MTAKDMRLKDRDITKTVEVDTLALHEKQKTRREQSGNQEKSTPWPLMVAVVVVIAAAAGGYFVLA
ncbi:MAG: hypothetical protein GWN84_00235 [Gammaproteobacteria bacterium]|nr:hypothetical protein [Gammaproteobacteria bacterium]NIR81633.1 hypothetical protein [Gammaproteobacteria bacterium]NIR88184.1 hypothetical protein [Gammaproteobacteria bacterium]NIU02745.1 hypothetical protein [Gammaproteobacteria bacterium]NIV73344.1 hypothetical protein [Gammaproteobacteria bacterium]